MTEQADRGAARETTPRAGVYSVTCRRTGRVYVGCSDHMNCALDDHRSRLDQGIHPNYAMQADWNTYGSGSFDLVIHEEINDADRETAYELHVLRDLWVDLLGVDEGRSY